ncbi:hypothetical protein IscW_ISCW006012 [Ixodes scapularis]|uniref:Uncharacterized protein n=1 Tax=Ixodes scapularis TaxID=6945 RepID=B7PQ60_IXOSC|nr:hypothetical protein IscW_ISCW006012 [Ixodes scapularis]|eukprot:XP_002435902.1 hypothetical protein IscW_ISCW006012 [Ixodes scapularis]
MAAPSKVADDQSVSPEPFQRALSLYRRRRFAECADACQLLPHIPQAHWLQLRALTQQAWLDELELDDEPLAQTLLDDHALAQTARPGTSLRAPGPTASARPLTREGRPVTGVRRRPQSRATTSGAGIERVLRTAAGGARTARVPSTLGVPTAELYNNLALCCFYAQQYDVALTCFERALSLAGDQLLADIWYNLGHVALAGDLQGCARAASQCSQHAAGKALLSRVQALFRAP